MKRIPRKLKKKWKKEMVKCYNDYAYMYGKYVTIKARRPDPLTDRQKELLHNCKIEYLTSEEIINKYCT